MNGKERKHQLEKALDDAGWGLLLLAIGALAMPNGSAEYAAVAGIGAAFLALNAIRIAAGLAVVWFSLVLGATGVLAGSLALAGTHVDAFVVFFAFAGAATVAAAGVRIVRPTPAV